MAFFLLVAGLWAGASAAANVDVRVMTYNIQGREASGWKLSDPKVQALVRQLQRYRPDVVGFQEVPDDFASVTRAGNKTVLQQVVEQAFPGEGYHVAVGPLRFGERSVVISRWPIAESSSFLGDSSLSAFGDSHTFRKDLFHARIGNFHFFTAHLKAYLQKPANIPWRLAEARAIQHFLVNQFPTFRRGPYVLVGDMNEDINNPRPGHNIGAINALLAGTGLNLITPVREGSNDNDTWWDGKDPDPRKRFDYILPDASLVGTINGRMKVGGRWPDAMAVSDHYPVMATFSIPSETLTPPGSNNDAAVNNAAASPISAPDTVYAGEPFTATVNLWNTGSKRWEGGVSAPHGLGYPNEMGGDQRWGVTRVALLQPVPPGGYTLFTIHATAPMTLGPQEFKWQMVQEGVEWFGQTTSKMINVVQRPQGTNDAAAYPISAPDTVYAGEPFTASVNMLNTGSKAWEGGTTPHGLGYPNEISGDRRWGVTRVAAEPTSPGGLALFTIRATAPMTLGPQEFKWQMVEDGVAWFGEPTSKIINVVSRPSGNDAAVIKIHAPDSVAAGETFHAQISFTNTGTKRWDSGANPHRLGSALADMMFWGVGSLDLPHEVPPNWSVTFNITGRAPTTPGSYDFKWRMLEDQVEWFGATASKTITVVGRNNASVLTESVRVPDTVVVGEGFDVSIEMRNTGGVPWTSNYRLGSQSPQDNVWGLNRVGVLWGGTVWPNRSGRFSFRATAPQTPGTYRFEWRMVEEGREWFGEPFIKTIRVTPRDDAQFTGVRVPRPVAAGRRFPVAITVTNTGGMTWTPASHRLVVRNGTVWGVNQVPVPRDVAPGQAVTFQFEAAAPATAGFHQMSLQMEVVRGNSLGGLGPTMGYPIDVARDDAGYTRLSVPGAVTTGQRFPVAITMTNRGGMTWTPSSHRLVVRNGGMWGVTQVPVPHDVAPGQALTFQFDATAPATPGFHPLTFQMEVAQGAWIGGVGPTIGTPIEVKKPN